MKIKKLAPDAKIPVKATSSAAGVDLCAYLPEYGDKDIDIESHQTIKVPTGIAVAIPEGYVGLIFARSGTATKKDLAPANKVGVIDSDYRGELIVALHNHGRRTQSFKHGDRIAQLVVVPCLDYEFEEVDELPATNRGEGGFGSTGA